MRKRISIYDLAEAVTAIAYESPNTVYKKVQTFLPAPQFTSEECRYFHNKAPSCLLGHALHRIGVEASDIDESENKAVIWSVDIFNDDDDTDEFQETVEWLTSVQKLQDEDIRWGLCIHE